MTALPELCHDHGCYCGAHESECVFRLREALAIAWEALEPFAKNAGWAREKPMRACGVGCSMISNTDHDGDCLMMKAKDAMRRISELGKE